jgi:hypothetical protein
MVMNYQVRRSFKKSGFGWMKCGQRYSDRYKVLFFSQEIYIYINFFFFFFFFFLDDYVSKLYVLRMMIITVS